MYCSIRFPKARKGQNWAKRSWERGLICQVLNVKILFSILTLVKNHSIKVLSDKNSYLQWCDEEFGRFSLFCIILMMESVITYVILQGVNNNRN